MPTVQSLGGHLCCNRWDWHRHRGGRKGHRHRHTHTRVHAHTCTHKHTHAGVSATWARRGVAWTRRSACSPRQGRRCMWSLTRSVGSLYIYTVYIHIVISSIYLSVCLPVYLSVCARVCAMQAAQPHQCSKVNYWGLRPEHKPALHYHSSQDPLPLICNARAQLKVSPVTLPSGASFLVAHCGVGAHKAAEGCGKGVQQQGAAPAPPAEAPPPGAGGTDSAQAAAAGGAPRPSRFNTRVAECRLAALALGRALGLPGWRDVR